MGNQKTIDKNTDTKTSDPVTETKGGTKSKEPPSWSELAGKTNAKKGTASMLGVGTLALAGTFLLSLPFSLVLFAVTLVTGAVGLSDVKSGAIGGAAAGVFSQLFLSGLLGFFASFTIAPLVIPVLVGLIAGGVGAFIGSKVKDSITG
jgi:hypothetical protein